MRETSNIVQTQPIELPRGQNMRATTGGWALPVSELVGRGGGMGRNSEARTHSSGGRAKKSKGSTLVSAQAGTPTDEALLVSEPTSLWLRGPGDFPGLDHSYRVDTAHSRRPVISELQWQRLHFKSQTFYAPNNWQSTVHQHALKPNFRPEKPPDSSLETFPEYIQSIHKDLKPWKKPGITKKMVDKAKNPTHTRIVVVNGRLC
ncbi:hypothetical protein LguiB_003369 [Lonicera macranthoides]